MSAHVTDVLLRCIILAKKNVRPKNSLFTFPPPLLLAFCLLQGLARSCREGKKIIESRAELLKTFVFPPPHTHIIKCAQLTCGVSSGSEESLLCTK